VDCTKAQQQLLDAVDGQIEEGELAALREHLARCSACRAEYDRLQSAAQALRTAAPVLAPQQKYLTNERLERLMVDYGRETRILRLYMSRGLVAAAAIAAILVSTAVIVVSLPGVVPGTQPAPMVAEAPARPPVVPVVLTSAGQGEPMRQFRRLTIESPEVPVWDRWDRDVRFVGNNTEGLVVPVNHVFYDPEESSRWW